MSLPWPTSSASAGAVTDGGHDGRAAVITGASSRAGLAIAARLARRGDLVLMGSRDPAGCERVAAGLRARGAAAFAAPLDFTDARSIDRFVASAGYLVGEVDLLVTDAGLAEPDAFGRARRNRLFGIEHLAAQLVPPMIKNARGDVVVVFPELLAGAEPRFAPVRRDLWAWLSVLEAEFVGTRVRASTVRPAPGGGPVAPGDIGRLVAAMTDSAEPGHLRLVEVIPPGSPEKAVTRTW